MYFICYEIILIEKSIENKSILCVIIWHMLKRKVDIIIIDGTINRGNLKWKLKKVISPLLILDIIISLSISDLDEVTSMY